MDKFVKTKAVSLKNRVNSLMHNFSSYLEWKYKRIEYNFTTLLLLLLALKFSI